MSIKYLYENKSTQKKTKTKTQMEKIPIYTQPVKAVIHIQQGTCMWAKLFA